MNKEIEALMDAYVAELGNEAVTITAILRYVSHSCNERKKLVCELEKYFRSENFISTVSAPVDHCQDFEDRTRKLLFDLENSFARARNEPYHAQQPPVYAHFNGGWLPS